jgi:8-oxo-dGTP diphosphatase
VCYLADVGTPRGPLLTVDTIIEVLGGIVLIKRRFPPPGWALPGGFVEYGETVEAAAVREALEETNLRVTLTDMLGVYSDPRRDARHHTVAVVFIGTAAGTPVAGDDAGEVTICAADNLPDVLAFDHQRIVDDYLALRRSGRRPFP